MKTSVWRMYWEKSKNTQVLDIGTLQNIVFKINIFPNITSNEKMHEVKLKSSKIIKINAL